MEAIADEDAGEVAEQAEQFKDQEILEWVEGALI